MKVLSFVALFLLIGGCQNKPPTPEETAALRQQRIDQLREQSRQRLNREPDAEVATSRPFAPGYFAGAWEQLKEVYQRITQQGTALQDLEKLGDRENPDNRREGIYGYVDRTIGRKPNAARLYGYIVTGGEQLLADTDYTVRAAAVRAINRCRFREFTPELIKLLANRKEPEAVRLEAAKALANIPDENALNVLVQTLGNADENKDIRIACADALRTFRSFAAAQALVQSLGDRDFGVAWQAQQSLVILTGKDFGYQTPQWLEYLTSAEKPFG